MNDSREGAKAAKRLDVEELSAIVVDTAFHEVLNAMPDRSKNVDDPLETGESFPNHVKSW
ncbi:MAG: hypothetical protein HYX92_10750 [Chloroflexi bacterium]|nr:hypothetical protein [Chloroflexota bacterium]